MILVDKTTFIHIHPTLAPIHSHTPFEKKLGRRRKMKYTNKFANLQTFQTKIDIFNR